MKDIVVLALVVVFQLAGNACLSHGMRSIGVVPGVGFMWVIAGTLLLVGYFMSYLAALSWLDLSYVLLMTASGYVLNTLIAWKVLGEAVSLSRWLGTLVICVGILLTGFDGKSARSGAGLP